MMRARYFLGLASAVLIGALPAAAPAQDAPKASVKVRDLDLTSPAGRQTADQRLRASANTQCPEASPNDLHGMAEQRACQRDLVTRGRSQIAVAAAGAENERMAEARRLAQISTKRRVVRHTAAPHRMVAHRKVVHHRVVRHHIVHKTAITHKTS